jgi:DNA invertase Pin-like site-specific DNA recombinase
MNTAYGYVRPSTHKHVLSSQAQMEEIRQAHEEKCPGVPWGAFFEDLEASLHLPLAKREAGRQLLSRLEPGDHVFLTRVGLAFRSLREASACLENWMDRGINVHLLDCPDLDTSTAEGSKLLLKALAFYAEIKRSWSRERRATP